MCCTAGTNLGVQCVDSGSVYPHQHLVPCGSRPRKIDNRKGPFWIFNSISLHDHSLPSATRVKAVDSANSLHFSNSCFTCASFVSTALTQSAPHCKLSGGFSTWVIFTIAAAAFRGSPGCALCESSAQERAAPAVSA